MKVNFRIDDNGVKIFEIYTLRPSKEEERFKKLTTYLADIAEGIDYTKYDKVLVRTVKFNPQAEEGKRYENTYIEENGRLIKLHDNGNDFHELENSLEGIKAMCEFYELMLKKCQEQITLLKGHLDAVASGIGSYLYNGEQQLISNKDVPQLIKKFEEDSIKISKSISKLREQFTQKFLEEVRKNDESKMPSHILSNIAKFLIDQNNIEKTKNDLKNLNILFNNKPKILDDKSPKQGDLVKQNNNKREDRKRKNNCLLSLERENLTQPPKSQDLQNQQLQLNQYQQNPYQQQQIIEEMQIQQQQTVENYNKGLEKPPAGYSKKWTEGENPDGEKPKEDGKGGDFGK